MQEGNDPDLIEETSIGKVISNILICSLTILILGSVINFYYAVGYLLILIFHELGHYVVAKLLEVKVVFGGFTPLGAYIVHENVKSCKENALIAIGGPLFGSVLGVIYYVVYYFTGDGTFFMLSLTSIMLSLGNLIPVKPLDGGHVAEAIAPIICYILVISLAISAVYFYNITDRAELIRSIIRFKLFS